jgi:hypothetical protein
MLEKVELLPSMIHPKKKEKIGEGTLKHVEFTPNSIEGNKQKNKKRCASLKHMLIKSKQSSLLIIFCVSSCNLMYNLMYIRMEGDSGGFRFRFRNKTIKYVGKKCVILVSSKY